MPEETIQRNMMHVPIPLTSAWRGQKCVKDDK